MNTAWQGGARRGPARHGGARQGWTHLPDGSGLVRGDKPVIDWPSIREYVLNRDERICQICYITVATDVDHIWPRRLGGRDHIDNLRAACGPCNKAKSDRVEYLLASQAELMLGVDAISKRIDAEVSDFAEIVHYLSSRGMHGILYAQCALADIGLRLRAVERTLGEGLERQRVYDAAPDADVLPFPPEVPA